MHSRLVLVLSSLILSFFGYSQERGFTDVETYQLPNGFTVLLNRDTTATKIYGGVVVNAGAKDEDPEATGMAHYLEHLLFKGTDQLGSSDYIKEKPYLDRIDELYAKLEQTMDKDQRISIQKEINENAIKASKFGLPNEFQKLLSSIGSTGINAFTRYDMTFYHNAFPSHELNRWLDIYAERFRNPVFRSFQSELEVVFEEKNRAMDNMERKVMEAVQQRIFSNQPYGQWSVLGKVEHLKNPNINRMYDFYDKYYVANNMALVLTGNFSTEEAKALIDQAFSSLEPADIDRPVIEPLKKIEGLQTDKVRLTPVKAEFRGFQTVPLGHPDRVALDVAEYLLANESSTGLIDELMAENKLYYSGGFSLNYNQTGGYVIFCVPKILTQSMGNARKLIDERIARLKRGDFDSIRMQIAKRELIQSFQGRTESLYGRAILIAEAYNLGITWEEYLEFDDEVSAVTKEDVVRVGEKYFGDNMLRVISRTGFGKEGKLPKPPYKAVTTDQEGISSYASQFGAMSVGLADPKFIDFNNDVEQISIEGGHVLYVAPNPISSRYRLRLKYHKGTQDDLRLFSLSTIIQNVGIQSGDEVWDAKTFKKKLAALGTEISSSGSHNNFVIDMTGTIDTYDQSMIYLSELLQRPVVDDLTEDVVRTDITTNRELSKSNPSLMGRAVFEYAVYGEESGYKRRPKSDQIKKLDIDDQLAALQALISENSLTVTYYGKTSAQQLASDLQNLIPLSSEERRASIENQKPRAVSQNEIILVNNGKVHQSQIYVYVPGESFEEEENVSFNAFNNYFAGGFNGLMKQEIREYRSLAYSTGGNAIRARTSEGQNRFYGFIGCQSDKTNEAIDVLMGLITDMPRKEDRVSDLAKYLQQSVVTSYPEFKALADQVATYKEEGYSVDPNQEAYAAYSDLSMDDIVSFYDRHMSGKPIVISIYGDLKKIDKKALEKYGKVTEMKINEVVNF